MAKVPASEAQGKGGPAINVYGNDVVFDQALLECTRAARSFWSDLWMIVLHNAPVRGYLLRRNGQPHTPATLAKIFSDTEAEIAGWLEELVGAGAAFVTGADNDPHAGEHAVADGVIYCKRQAFKEARKRARDVANGKLGGNPELLPEYDAGMSDLRLAHKRDTAADRQRKRRQKLAAEKRAKAAEDDVSPAKPVTRASRLSTVTKRDCHALSRPVTPESRGISVTVFEEKAPDNSARSNMVPGVNPHNHYHNHLRELPDEEAEADGGANAGTPATLTGGVPATAPDLGQADVRGRRDAACQALRTLQRPQGPPGFGAAPRDDLAPPDGPPWWRAAAEVLIVADPQGWRSTWRHAVPIADEPRTLRAPSLFAYAGLRKRVEASRGLLGEIVVEGPKREAVGA